MFDCSLKEELQRERKLLKEGLELSQNTIVESSPIRISEILCRHVKTSKDAIHAMSDIRSFGMGMFSCICFEELSGILTNIMSAYEYDGIQKIIEIIEGEMF